MNSAKKKAQELTDKFITEGCLFANAKKCSLISVAEIYKLKLKAGQYLEETGDKEMYYSFWEDVRSELDKISATIQMNSLGKS